MVLNLKQLFDISGDSKSLDYKILPETLEQYKGFSFISPIAIKGTLVNRAGILTIDFSVNVTMKLDCDRCLNEFERDFSFDFNHILVRSTNRQNDEYIVCSEDKLDLDELAISDLLLQLPTKTLCSDDCKGLCYRCGSNLNVQECSCFEE